MVEPARGRVLIAALALAALAACASTGEPAQPAYTVVEENAEIADRSLIRRISILDNDTLLVEEAVNRYYRVRLFPGCVDITDILTPVRLRETGIGLDRTSQFIVGAQTCPVRAIDRVERTRPAAAEPEQAAPADAGADQQAPAA